MMGVAHAHASTTPIPLHAAGSLESSPSSSSFSCCSQSDIPFVHAATSGLAGQFTVTVDDDDLSVDSSSSSYASSSTSECACGK